MLYINIGIGLFIFWTKINQLTLVYDLCPLIIRFKMDQLYKTSIRVVINAGTCVDSSKKCNCDRNTAPETSDEGYLTDKDALPVTGLFFGDTDASDEFGWHTLGPLICSGRQ